MKFCKVIYFVSILFLFTCNLYPQEKPLKLEINIDSTVYYQGKEINLNITFSNLTDKPVHYTFMEYRLKNLGTNKFIPSIILHYDDFGSSILGKDIQYIPFTIKDLFRTVSYPLLDTGKYSLQIYVVITKEDTLFSNNITFYIKLLPEKYAKYKGMLLLTDRTVFEHKKNYEDNIGGFFEYELYAAYIKAAMRNKSASSEDTLCIKNEIVKFLKQYPTTGYSRDFISFLLSPYNGNYEFFKSVKPKFNKNQTFAEKVFNSF